MSVIAKYLANLYFISNSVKSNFANRFIKVYTMEQQTKLEYLADSKPPYNDISSKPAKKYFPRVKVFIFSFLICLAIGLLINYIRPAVYQSSATLLTSAVTAVDQRSNEVDFENVTIQKQKLLGSEILSKTFAQLQTLDGPAQLTNLKQSDIRNMLSVKPIAETNLIEMQAHGDTPEVLPVVINTWIEIYLAVRELSVKNSTDSTVGKVKDELLELNSKIEQARTELDQFRNENDITSMVQEDNELPATHKGLTKALVTANEEFVKSKAKLDSINLAIANGQTVVPDQDQRSLSNLERRYQELKEQLTDFDKRFTREYMAMQPSLMVLPLQVQELGDEIKNKKHTGQNIVLSQASQEYYAAKQVVEQIKIQLDGHKAKTAKFNSLFSEHQKLIDDLESLEIINRETQDRLVKIESKQYSKYPQVNVIERASLNRDAISPNYNLGALIAFGIALIMGFVTVWTIEFLMRTDKTEQSDFSFNFSPWFGQSQQDKVLVHEHIKPALTEQHQNKLIHTASNQKLSVKDLQNLLEKSDPSNQQLILFLLSGVSLDEASELTIDDINIDNSTVQVSGNSVREVKIGTRLSELIKNKLELGALWDLQSPMTTGDLEAMLFCAKTDAGLSELESDLADVLRQSYITYLVEQGLRLSLLGSIVGHLTPRQLASYAEYSPAGEGCGLDEIQTIHPVCR